METERKRNWNIGDYTGPKSPMPEFTKFQDSPGDSLSPVKSQAFVAEVERQMEKTESEFDSKVKQFRYAKWLYSGAVGSASPILDDYDRNDESPIIERNSSDTSSNQNFVDDKNFENNLASGDSRYLENADDPQQGSQVDAKEESPVYTATTFEMSSNNFQHAQDENSIDSDGQNYFPARSRGEDSSLYKDSENYASNDSGRDRDKIDSKSPGRYQLNLAEYSKGLQSELEEESRIAESVMIGSVGRYGNAIESSRRENIKEPDIRLNSSESLTSYRSPIKVMKGRSEKQRRISSKIVSKTIEDAISTATKRKRKKRTGVKISNSRCTTATRDTSISENKKDTRKRKPRGNSTIPGMHSIQVRRQDHRSQNSSIPRGNSAQSRRQEISSKNQNNAREIVEIYHNSAVKSGSLSIVSSKHSKLIEMRPNVFNIANKFDQPSRIKGNYKFIEQNEGNRHCDDIEEQNSRRCMNDPETETVENHTINKENCKNYFQELDLRSGEPNTMNCQTNLTADKNSVTKDYQSNRPSCQLPRLSSPRYDSLSARNYQSPTVASKMKRARFDPFHRRISTYFNTYNFRNIPFVVGTSVTPSYNLGLNIQEARGLMKTKLMMANGSSSLEISNVTKGFKPVLTLLGCTNGENEFFPGDPNIPFKTNSGFSNLCPEGLNGDKTSRSVHLGPFSLKTPRLSCINDIQTIHEAQESYGDPKIEITSKKPKTGSICSSIKFAPQKNFDIRSELTQSALLRQRQEELNMGDTQPVKWQNMANNTKGIRDVLMNFHDHYEAMITKYETLQEQAKKANNKSLEKEMEALEKELNAKEEEINAVASLYQEVMILKQQMRLIHERNSLVCIATESPGSPTCPQFSFRAKTANPIRTIHLYKRGGSPSNQGPPASAKLAGLLRQIKTFQKQLKSST